MALVGPVIYAIYVNGLLQRDFALDVELRQEWSKHDLFFIRVEYQKTDKTLVTKQLWADNAPISIVWGRTPGNTQTWYGYVNHHTINANSDSGSKVLQVSYTLIGTSKPMNTDKTRTWGEVTGTYIAKTIAQEYGLRTVVTKTTWVLPYEVQASESDFQFMVRIADKMGYRFWVSGGTLYFIDPAVVLLGSGSQGVPKYYLDKSFMYLDTVREFHMLQGDNLPGAGTTTRTIYGVDKTSGQVFASSADPSATTSQLNTDWPADSINEAQNLVGGWQSRSQFFMSATAELYGNVYVYPGKLVYLSGKQLHQDATGYWIVSSADHVLKASGSTDVTQDRYVTRVQILRNATTLTPKLKSITKIAPEFTSMKSSGTKWVSTNQSVIYDSPV